MLGSTCILTKVRTSVQYWVDQKLILLSELHKLMHIIQAFLLTSQVSRLLAERADLEDRLCLAHQEINDMENKIKVHYSID